MPLPPTSQPSATAARGRHPLESALHGASRVSRWLAWVGGAMMLACAVLALDGYVYTTAILLDAQFASVGMVTAIAVLHGLLSRWFVLGERRLALKRLEQKREAEAQARSAEADAGDGGEAVPLELDEEITLEKVNAHSRSLLRALKLTLLVVGLAELWMLLTDPIGGYWGAWFFDSNKVLGLWLLTYMPVEDLLGMAMVSSAAACAVLVFGYGSRRWI